MPKMKTHKSSAKRFKVSSSGKIIRSKAYKSHIMTKKTAKRKRNLRKDTTVSSAEVKNIKVLLPYS
ncbi:50S ribosomal protein L35 [bacterium]|uniref:Large ribosomal subunit protein bL35 n=1 Tax=Candidatus Sediminicultor quintus TaxID=1797291 RepID=A0A1F5AG48_9BACT|nr:50S ribosomal protein L35 [bacterium]MCG2762716.1 50S ribosomal protein L35 [Candidatus Atribacteria bacterium]OGD17465.1 MAG: 50S ribosomal protein L35 [Candidatus Atribacteria bacterium RBG_19FT_COMBO_35_14]OGD35030.1 MAG: 50S ribosomal protein L35 [Candidatus Atribacteria bacterium RBG_16_35_8]MBU4361736.1 50S ribosomal protein L35 [bacterium]